MSKAYQEGSLQDNFVDEFGGRLARYLNEHKEKNETA
jgi:hypothetical protein